MIYLKNLHGGKVQEVEGDLEGEVGERRQQMMKTMKLQIQANPPEEEEAEEEEVRGAAGEQIRQKRNILCLIKPSYF